MDGKNKWQIRKCGNMLHFSFHYFNVKTFFRKKVSLGCQLFLCVWLRVSSHDAMNPPAVVFEGFKVWVCTLTDITAICFSLLVSKQVFLQTVHSAKPAETNGAAHRLDGRLAGPAPLVE